MSQFAMLAIAALLAACSSRGPSGSVGVHSGYEKLKIGRFQSRALFRTAENKLFGEKAPLVILIPGSGAQGPEESVPGKATADGQDSFLFLRYGEALTKAGAHVLLLGKPGVEFFSGWDPSRAFYNKERFEKLKWQDLIDNARDAIDWAQSDSRVNPDRVWLLGHSEGTQVAVDVATTLVPLEGLLLLGYLGEDMKSILQWQLFEREIEWFISRDVDVNKDGYVSRDEAASWPSATWPFEANQTRISTAKFQEIFRGEASRKAFYESVAQSPLYGDGVFNRGPQYLKAALLGPQIHAFTGELDIQTPSREARALEAACKRESKSNCSVRIIPGVGHAFSVPRPPRGHPLLDATLGPPTPDFLNLLTEEFQRILSRSQPQLGL